MEKPTRRKQPIHWLPQPDHPSPIIFLTCCTKARRACLDRDVVHTTLLRAWKGADRWRVGRYVIMPDHLHLFCAPMPDANALDRWIAYWKSLATRALGEDPGSLWQREFWDHQLRRGDSYEGKWEYVRDNPVRAGLVSRSEDWPYQGEVNPLEWLGRR
jgi:REP element-mobilizing transposase RayT